MEMATTLGPSRAASGGVAPSWRARARAIGIDLALGVALQAGALVLALVIFMVDSRAGARDLSTLGASAGWAALLAAVPAWLGLLAYGSWSGDATPGQHAAGLAVEGTPRRRLLRLAIHPLGLAGWAWLAILAMLATAPFVVWATLALMAGAIASVSALAAMLPRAPALHDLLAGTRLVMR